VKTIRGLALLLGLALLGTASVTGASGAAPARYDFTDPAPAAPAHHDTSHDTSMHPYGAVQISPGRVREIRRATAKFHNIATAESAGYVQLKDRDGTLRLAALEYLVDRSTWDAHHSQRPQLFRGHRFDLTEVPNHYDLAPFYSQHVWAWKRNPDGLLSMWNPAVHCAWARGVTHTHVARARVAGARRTIAV
jgi:hypothetical protein